jgi:hypothetical protein
LDIPIFTTVTPSYAEVLEVRAGRVGMVRDFLATVTSDELAATRKNPWAPEHQETTLSCLQVILDEEWEHHRYAVRDLDAIEAKSDAWADDRSSPSSSFSLPAATRNAPPSSALASISPLIRPQRGYALRDSPVVDGSRWLPLADAVNALRGTGKQWVLLDHVG